MRVLILSGEAGAEEAAEVAAALDGIAIVLHLGREIGRWPAAERLAYGFQPDLVHLFGLDAAVARDFIAIAARVPAQLVIHLPTAIDWAKPAVSAMDDALFRALRDGGDLPRRLPRLRWSALAESWTAAVGPHPFLAAVLLRLAGAFTTGAAAGATWLDPADPRPLRRWASPRPAGAGEALASLYAAAAATFAAPGSVSQARFPVVAGSDALAEGPRRSWLGRLSSRWPTPQTARLLDLVDADLRLARSASAPPQRRLAAELHRLVRVVLHHEKRRLRFLLALPRRPAGTAAELPADAAPVAEKLSPEEAKALLAAARWPGCREPEAPAGRPALLVLTPFLARGGAEQELEELLVGLASSHSFAIATLEPHRPELGDRRADFAALAPLYQLGALGRPAARLALVEALADRLGSTLVYGANGCDGFYSIAAGLRRSRPALAVADHLYDHREGYVRRYRPGLPLGIDGCLAENGRIAAELTELRGWPSARVFVLPPCPRRPEDLPAPEARPRLRAAVRAELGLGEDDILFLCAARLHPQKRPFDLIALASRLADLPHLHFLLVGGGELEPEVAALLAALPGNRLRRWPFRNDVPRLLCGADVGCLLSEYEGMPVFLVESLQLGVPFLGTDVGGLGELLRATGAGFLAPPGDLDALAAAARRLADPAERRTCAARANAAGAALAGPGRSAVAAAAFALIAAVARARAAAG